MVTKQRYTIIESIPTVTRQWYKLTESLSMVHFITKRLYVDNKIEPSYGNKTTVYNNREVSYGNDYIQ